MREVTDERRDVEDQVGGRVVLSNLAVDRADDVQVVTILDLVDRHEHGTDRAERVEGLAEIEMRRLRGELDRSVGDVLADGEADDVVPRIGDADVLAAPADHDEQFAFVVASVAAQLDVRGRTDDARRELREHERAVGHVHSALGGVSPEVEADSERFLRARYGRAEDDVGEQPRDRRLVEPRREFGEEIGPGECRHRIGPERAR